MLLLDENIAARLASSLAELYSGCAHGGNCGLAGASDLAIWRYARATVWWSSARMKTFSG